ncbi:MAG: hypothetical protein OXI73_16560 [Rhodospirillales bacterium]|nr:hypothetical protein [Rhodospirillales bacterium]
MRTHYEDVLMIRDDIAATRRRAHDAGGLGRHPGALPSTLD